MSYDDWKIDKRPMRHAWAPGNYFGKCSNCDGKFLGDKRALTCADCAYAEPDRAAPTMSTLEERARELQALCRVCTDSGLLVHGDNFCTDAILALARSAQVEALERAAERAEGWTKKFGNPNGSAYEQGQNDMGFRVVTNFRAEAKRVRNGGTL